MSPELPILKAKEVIGILEKANFFIHHQTGSHVQMKHLVKPDIRVTIPKHNKDLPKPIIRSIVKQAGLSVEEFKSLL